MEEETKELEQVVSIPVDEYAELIECKTRLNTVYSLLTKQHETVLHLFGRKANVIDVFMVEIASGYEENEDYFNKLRENFKRRTLR